MMDYKARLYMLRHEKVAGPIKKAESDRKIRHELAMDELAAQRGLHGLSDADKAVIEAATIEILTMDTVFNTVPHGKRNSMMKKAVKKAMQQIAADLRFVVKEVLGNKDSATKGNYASHRYGQIITFSYYNECYVSIDMAKRSFTLTQVPNYATARRMVKFLAGLCGLALPDMQPKTYQFKVIHDPDN